MKRPKSAATKARLYQEVSSEIALLTKLSVKNTEIARELDLHETQVSRLKAGRMEAPFGIQRLEKLVDRLRTLREHKRREVLLRTSSVVDIAAAIRPVDFLATDRESPTPDRMAEAAKQLAQYLFDVINSQSMRKPLRVPNIRGFLCQVGESGSRVYIIAADNLQTLIHELQHIVSREAMRGPRDDQTGASPKSIL